MQTVGKGGPFPTEAACGRLGMKGPNSHAYQRKRMFRNIRAAAKYVFMQMIGMDARMVRLNAAVHMLHDQELLRQNISSISSPSPQVSPVGVKPTLL